MVDPGISAGEVCEMIAGRLNYADGGENSSRYFALFESVDGAIPRRALGRSEVVLNVLPNMDVKIIYMMKLFMPSALEMVETDPIMLHLQYIQGLHSVVTGTHFANEIPTLVKLAALDVQAKYGPHDPSVHQVGFLTQRLHEFIPAHVFDKNRKIGLGRIYLQGTSKSITSYRFKCKDGICKNMSIMGMQRLFILRS